MAEEAVLELEDEESPRVTTASVLGTEEEEAPKGKAPNESQEEPDVDIEQRLKDTQNWGHEQSQQLAAANRELESFRAQATEEQQKQQAAHLDGIKERVSGILDADTYYDDPVAAQKEVISALLEAFHGSLPTDEHIRTIVADQTRRDMWGENEKTFMSDTPDYESYVNDVFVDHMAQNANLRSVWEEKGQTPQVLYDMAKQFHAFDDYMKDPDSYYQTMASEDGPPPPPPSRSQGNTGDIPSAPPPPGEAPRSTQGMNQYLFSEADKKRKSKRGRK